MGLRHVAPASDLLVTLDEAKLACRIDATMGSTEDAWLTRKIAAVGNAIEAFLGKSVLPQTWELSVDEFSDNIELPRGPVTSVTSIKYDDADGVEQTLDGSVYVLDLVSNPQWVVRASDESWPATLDRVNAVRILFVAQFAEGPVLERVRDVAQDVLASWYENRGGDMEFPRWAKDRLRDLRQIVI